MSRSPRAFTLMEMAVVLALLGVVGACATMVFTLFIGNMKKTRLELRAKHRSETALDYIIKEITYAGALGVPLDGSLILEQNCGARAGLPACDNSDRLTIIQPLDGFGQCRVVTDLTGQVVVNSDIIPDPGPPAVCCLSDDLGFQRQAVFVGTTGEVFAAVLHRTGACTYAYTPIVAPPSASLTGARLVMADVKTLYREPGGASTEPGKLVMHLDLDGDGSIVGERLYLADDILEFQVREQADGVFGLSVVAGAEHPTGVTAATTVFSTVRPLARPYIAREATAHVFPRAPN